MLCCSCSQIGGISIYTEDWSNATGVYREKRRLLDVRLSSTGCKDVNPTATYLVLTDDASAAGIGGTTELQKGSTVVVDGRLLVDIVADYIQYSLGGAIASYPLAGRRNYLPGFLPPRTPAYVPRDRCLPFSFTLLHINDLHSRVLPADGNHQICNIITGTAADFGEHPGPLPMMVAATALGLYFGCCSR